MRVPITNNVSRQMNRQTKIKLTNLNSKSKDVAAFHAKRRHVPGHGRVQFLAFALHLSETHKKKEKHSAVSFIAARRSDVICSVNVIGRRLLSEPLARSKSNFRMIAACSITVGTSITCCSFLCLYSTFYLFLAIAQSQRFGISFLQRNVFGCLSLRKVQKKLIQPEQPAPEYGHGHSAGGDTDEREC